LIIFITFTVLFAIDNNSIDLVGSLELSEAEKEWLSQNYKVRIIINNYPPYMILHEDKIEGISIDYLKTIFEFNKIDYEFIIAPEKSWFEIIEEVSKKENFDLIPVIRPDDERRKTIGFTEIYLSSPNVIFTREDYEFISGIKDLYGKTISLHEGFVINKTIKELYQEINIIEYGGDIENCLYALAQGDVDAFIGNLTVGSYT